MIFEPMRIERLLKFHALTPYDLRKNEEEVNFLRQNKFRPSVSLDQIQANFDRLIEKKKAELVKFQRE